MNHKQKLKNLSHIQLIEYFKDAVIILNKSSLKIDFLNYEAEIILDCSKSKVINSSIKLFFQETSLIFDYIQNSLIKNESITYNDVKVNNFSNIFRLDIINNDQLDFMILVFKSDSNLISSRQIVNNKNIFFDEVLNKIIEKLKNPIMSIRGATQIIKKENKSKSYEFIDIILDECDKIFKLINNFELDKKHLDFNKNNENIHKILRDCMKLFKNKENDSINFIEDFDPSLPEVFINKKNISLVFYNLIINSIESIKSVDLSNKNKFYIKVKTNFISGSNIKLPNIKKKEFGGFIQIIIEDNGVGIDSKFIDNIFFPFFSMKSKDRGFGLYLVKEIIKDHEGFIDAKSKKNKTEFLLNLPIKLS
tara:strand:- start:2431 stop:3522 length:1092 start_codon:yes stop_codon:yes gene_type:complete